MERESSTSLHALAYRWVRRSKRFRCSSTYWPQYLFISAFRFIWLLLRFIFDRDFDGVFTLVVPDIDYSSEAILVGDPRGPCCWPITIGQEGLEFSAVFPFQAPSRMTSALSAMRPLGIPMCLLLTGHHFNGVLYSLISRPWEICPTLFPGMLISKWLWY